MDVSPIVARLTAQCPTFAQIIAAETGGTQNLVATQANLYTLLNGSVGGRMYPLQLPEQPTHPSIVYQMVSSTTGTFEGYDITKTDIFVLNIRGEDYDELLTLNDTIITALVGEQIEIFDTLHEYDQTENLFRINIEIRYTYINAASQSMPAAFVYPISRAGGENQFDNFTKQMVSQDFAILIVTADNNIPTLQDEIQAALVGWQQSQYHYQMEYATGASIEGVGDLLLWREVYRDAFYMTQA